MELTIEQALQQGVTAHKEGKLQEAQRIYSTILQSQPAHPDANHNLGVIAVSVDKVELALPLFKAALEANPKVEQFWLSYIDALIKENQFETAKNVLEKGRNAGLVSDKLDVLEAQVTQIKQAKGQSADDIGPSQSSLDNLLNHYQNGRRDEAEKLAVSITQQYPKHQLGWKVLGAIFKQTARISEALNANQKSVALSPQDPEAYSNLGATLKALGRLNEAEASYKQAIFLKPDFSEAHSNLGNTLKELGRLEAAIECYKEALKIKPDYAEAHNNLGITLTEMGRLDEAEVSYRQVIALKPDNAGAHNNLGNTLTELSRLDEAEASYTRAIALKPKYAEALMNRWQLLFDKKEFDTALRDIDLCNTEKSRACGLETLYALGRIDEIYKRIEMQAEIDDGNLRMAALSAFISEREQKNTAHEFCQNPQSFIHFSNISSHLEDASTFVTGVIGELNKQETIWEPSGKTTIKGFQTLKHINLFANPSGKISQLKSIILNELDAYYLKFQNESCSFIQKWPSKKNLFGWHVILKKQGFQDSHIHPGGWLSGVIYLKIVPPLKKDEGAIEFSLNSKNYSDLKSPRLLHRPAQGDIVFFPSSLHHRTIPFTTDTDRIIVSFDLIPEAGKY